MVGSELSNIHQPAGIVSI